MTLKTVKTTQELDALAAGWRKAGLKVGLVPTMGALHAGHLSLLGLIQAEVDRVVVSIFVNPTQFGAGEDFETYPRDNTKDLEKLGAADLVYMPEISEMYPGGAKTIAAKPDLSGVLCGKFRPGHFDGVATIVAKLFRQVQPDAAIFGEKDYQQLQVIRALVADFAMPVKILAAPTVREADGLAVSSRNAYLTNAERKLAALLPATLIELIEETSPGGDLRKLEIKGNDILIQAGFNAVDYIEFREGSSLALSQSAGTETRIFAAAHIGKTRLIDNMPVTVSVTGA